VDLLPSQATELALLLAGDGAESLPERARVLLGLEAHAMFAAAARRERPEMLDEFGRFAPHWARAVLTMARLMNARGGPGGRP
jgi:hypothetical protein